MSFSRRELLRRATALVLASRLPWLEQAFASTPQTVRQTLDALVEFVLADRKLAGVTTPRLIRTLDRFLPGELPLSATAASILNGVSRQVKPGATFATLTSAEKAKVFELVARLPLEAGSIKFLVGNLADLTAFLAYSTPLGRRRARYSGLAHGHKEFKGYWHA